MNDTQRVEALESYYSEHGVLPSYSTIAKITGYKSKNSVFELIDRLKHDEIIDLTPEKRIKPGTKFKKSKEIV